MKVFGMFTAALFVSGFCLADNAQIIPYSVLKTLPNGTEVRNGGFGSAMTGHPTKDNRFYALTDRGPNATYKGDAGTGKKFPVPEYTPRIHEYKVNGDNVTRVREILLKDNHGNLITGLPNPKGMGATGEVPYDNQGNVLKFDPYGLDSEGLVALSDGTFWISDEYGPHIVHYSRDGVELERINPFGSGTMGRKLPAVFANRRANRGMEGLAVTPDEKMLVGIMQSTMYNPSKAKATNTTLARIVTFVIDSGETHQYLYQQDAANLSNSEIATISNHEFIVVERDGGFFGADKPAKYKNLYKIDLDYATDVSGDFNSPYGLMVDDKALEQLSWGELKQAGIRPAKKTLVMDLLKRNHYPHDKLEGLWLRGSHTISVLNDDDFAVTVTKGEVVQKHLPANDEIDSNILYTFEMPISLINY